MRFPQHLITLLFWQTMLPMPIWYALILTI